MEDFKYKTVFSSQVRPLVSEEKDTYLALASLENIGDLIPDVDSDKNVDLLPIAFNAFVANRVNKNHDVIDTASAMAIANYFVNKPINVEHNRNRVIGTILTAGYSEFGTDRSLTEEQVKEMEGPFNVSLGGVVWRTVNEDIADLIEDSSDPTSENYLLISASWELGFSDYQLVVLSAGNKNLENAEFIKDPKKVEELESNLKTLGGEGTLEDGRFVYRQVIGEILPLGIGLTQTPAAEVKGIITPKLAKAGVKEGQAPVEPKPESISHRSEKNVKNRNKSEDKNMKINSVKDITDESLKEMSASAISDFIRKELEDASDKYSAEKVRVEEALSASEEKHTALSKEHKELKTNLEVIQTELEALKTEKLEREQQEAFNQRMSAMDEKYDLSDEDRKVISEDVKDMSNEDFETYSEKMAVLLSSKDRESLEKAEAESKAAEEKVTEEATPQAEEEKEEAKAEETAEEAVDEVLQENEIKAEVPVSTAANEPTTYDKYKVAFDMDGFDISSWR